MRKTILMLVLMAVLIASFADAAKTENQPSFAQILKTSDRFKFYTSCAKLSYNP